MKYYAEISYTINKDHPLYAEAEKNKDFKTMYGLHKFSDIYDFAEGWDEKEAEHYMKVDLMLIAGGGYQTDGVEEAFFEIRKATKRDLEKFE